MPYADLASTPREAAGTATQPAHAYAPTHSHDPGSLDEEEEVARLLAEPQEVYIADDRPPLTAANFATVFADLQQELSRRASRLADGDPHLAADIVQEVAARAWRPLAIHGKVVDQPRPWLHRIMTNIMTDYWRRRAAACRLGLEPLSLEAWLAAYPGADAGSPADFLPDRNLPDADELTSDLVARQHASAILERMPAELAPYLRMILEGMTNADIAMFLGIPHDAELHHTVERAKRKARAIALRLGIGPTQHEHNS
jgi:DNA-directed RNA polymerase specialized sigma24 family protein